MIFNDKMVWARKGDNRMLFRMSFTMTLSDLESVNKIINETKHRSVSLRQLSL